LFACLVIGLLACCVSCKAGKAGVSDNIGEEVESLPAETDDTEDVPSGTVGLVLDMGDGPDVILDAYRKAALQDGVLGFFQDLTGSRDVALAVLSNAASFEISPALAFALCWEESHYNPRAYNRNRNGTVDWGLFQLNSGTFPGLKADDFYDPDVNARKGLSHLRWCLNAAGTEVAALAMYNAGTTRVCSVGAPKNTLDYISRILKRRRKIEELFIAESPRIFRTETIVETAEKPEKAPLRLSLLTPLGR